MKRLLNNVLQDLVSLQSHLHGIPSTALVGRADRRPGCPMDVDICTAVSSVGRSPCPAERHQEHHLCQALLANRARCWFSSHCPG